MMIMEWKVIMGFSDYEISQDGKIRSLDRVKKYKTGRIIDLKGKEKKLRTHPVNGFLMTDLIDDKGKRHTIYPHKEVARAFIKNPHPRKNKVVIHIDGNITNNHVENLKWSTFSESIRIGFETGKRDNSDLWQKRRLKYGPKGGNKSMGRPDPLDFGQKKRIKYLRDEKGYTLQQLASKYNCSISHIHKTLKTFHENSIAV
jgi:hypothetical protein